MSLSTLKLIGNLLIILLAIQAWISWFKCCKTLKNRNSGVLPLKWVIIAFVLEPGFWSFAAIFWCHLE